MYAAKLDELLRQAEQALRTGKPEQCGAFCAAAIERDPACAPAHNLLGRALNNLRQLPRAEKAFREAVRLQPDFAEAHHNLAVVLRSRGSSDAAIAAFTRALELDPHYARAHHNLGVAHLMADDPHSAEPCLVEALQREPGNPRTLIHLGVARHRLGRHDEAVEAYRAALERAPGDADAEANLAITLQETGELEAAEAAYRRALAKRPGDGRIYQDLASLLVTRGEARGAVEACDACLALMPGHAGALATRAVALYALGERTEADRLVDFDRFVTAIDVEPPAPYPTLEAFNQAVAEHVRHHPSLAYERVGHATRLGRHTGNLLAGEKGPVALLEAAIRTTVTEYLEQHPSSEPHPFLASAPERWDLTAWAVVMDRGGHQLPHVHPSAWLSGVYYASLPAVMDQPDESRAGWIEFGRPPDEQHAGDGPPLHHIRPHEGLMLLFPSYFYHRTEPFESTEPRISIAFDVLRLD